MTVEECLDKFKEGFKDLPNLTYYFDSVIKNYIKYGEDQYEEIISILDKDVFTLRCRVGAVSCIMEYNCIPAGASKEVYGATFQNLITGQEVFFNTAFGYVAK